MNSSFENASSKNSYVIYSISIDSIDKLNSYVIDSKVLKKRESTILRFFNNIFYEKPLF